MILERSLFGVHYEHVCHESIDYDAEYVVLHFRVASWSDGRLKEAIESFSWRIRFLAVRTESEMCPWRAGTEREVAQ